MKKLVNPTTGEEIFANGPNFTNNKIRLNNGEEKDIPELWEMCSTELVSMHSKLIDKLATLDEYQGWNVVNS